MTIVRGASSRVVRAGIVGLLGAISGGCDADHRARWGYELDIPPAALPIAAAAAPAVPGEVLEAYDVPLEGGRSASIVVALSAYRPQTTAEQLLEESRNLVRSLGPSVRLEAAEACTLGSRPAVRLRLVVAGDGRSLSPNPLGLPSPSGAAGTVPTQRVWLRVLLAPPGPTLELVAHVPDSVDPEAERAILGALDSLRWTREGRAPDS